MQTQKKNMFMSTAAHLLGRFLGSGPKGPMSCRTQGGISRRPSFRPSVPPPVDYQGLKSALPGLQLALPGLKLAVPGLKLALPGLNLAL